MSSILYPTDQGAGNWEPEGEVCLQQVGAEVLPWEIQKHFMGISVCYVSLPGIILPGHYSQVWSCDSAHPMKHAENEQFAF